MMFQFQMKNTILLQFHSTGGNGEGTTMVKVGRQWWKWRWREKKKVKIIFFDLAYII